MSESVWEALPDVREALLDAREALSDAREWLESLLDDRESSGEPSACPKISYEYPGVVGRLSRLSGSG